MERNKRLAGDPYALVLLLLLLFTGVVLLFFRGLTVEADYPAYLPVFILCGSDPLLIILARYLPITCPKKDNKGLFELAVGELLLALVLVILSSSGTFGEEAKDLSAGFAAIAGVPTIFFHAFLLTKDAMKKEGASPLQKAIPALLCLALAALLLLAVVLVFQGNLGFAFFFALVPLFPLVFILLNLD